jgi:hypothetical protein
MESEREREREIKRRNRIQPGGTAIKKYLKFNSLYLKYKNAL